MKATVNAFLSALTGVVVTVIGAGGVFEVEVVVVTVLLTWATSVATYYGLLKPTNTAEVVQHATQDFGIGGSETHRHAA